MPTLVISTLPLNVVTSKTLLALRETRVSDVAALRWVDGQTTVGFFKTRIFAKISSLAGNKRHAPRVPSDVGNVQFKFGADPICHYGDIRAREDVASVGWKSRHRGRSLEDDSFTFDVREPNSAVI